MKKYILALLTFGLLIGFAFTQTGGETGGMTDEPATVVDVATSNEDFSTLVTALQTAGLVETLQGEGPFTVFAPTNEAFNALLEELGVTAEELLAREDLSDILTYHVAPEELLADDAVAAVEEAGGTAEVETLNGATLNFAIDGENVVVNDSATVTATNLQAGNGVVHVIDAVLLPESDSDND